MIPEVLRIHPGEILNNHHLIPLNMTVERFSKISGVKQEKCLKFLTGEVSVDDEIALAISTVFNTSVQMWHDLQFKYDNGMSRGEYQRKENAKTSS